MAHGSEIILQKRAPTLYAIIGFKLIKGLLLLSLALGIYRLADEDLVQGFRRFLQFIKIDPERRFFTDLARSLGHVTPANIFWVAAGTAFYSLFSLVEGVGMVFRAPWACWMAVGESLFFIPIEIYEMVYHPSWKLVVILVLNVVIAWYLTVNRHRLFKHHH
jgi:uncharacterized membrane protein (DUF2068 family)